MIDTIYYYWSATCPWCAKVEHLIKVLEMFGLKVVRVSIDEDVSSDLLDLNMLFMHAMGKGVKPIAPLIAIKYYREGIERVMFVFIPSEGDEEPKKDEESVKRDVAKLTLLTIKALRTLGINIDRFLEDKVILKLLEPLFKEN